MHVLVRFLINVCWRWTFESLGPIKKHATIAACRALDTWESLSSLTAGGREPIYTCRLNRPALGWKDIKTKYNFTTQWRIQEFNGNINFQHSIMLSQIPGHQQSDGVTSSRWHRSYHTGTLGSGLLQPLQVIGLTAVSTTAAFSEKEVKIIEARDHVQNAVKHWHETWVRIDFHSVTEWLVGNFCSPNKGKF